MEPSPFKEEKVPIPEAAWYTDGTSKSRSTGWTAVAIQLSTDNLVRNQDGQNSQWAEL